MTGTVKHNMPDFCRRHFPVHINTAMMTLMKLGVDLSQVDMLAIGCHENYKGEIRHQDPAPGTPLGPRQKITLKVGYPSAVDQMPYQVFYGLDNRTSRTAEWEDRSRRLMAPFDAAVIRGFARAEFENVRFLHGFVDSEHLSRFLDLFDFDARSNTDDFREMLVWAMLMPSFHTWAGNPKQVARALTCLLGYRVTITESVRKRYEIPDQLQYRLGSDTGRLGRSTIAGDSFEECDSCYQVTVEDVEPGQMSRFLPGQKTRHKIERILEHCMPGNLEYIVKIEPRQRACRLGQPDDGGYLGYTTWVH